MSTEAIGDRTHDHLPPSSQPNVIVWSPNVGGGLHEIGNNVSGAGLVSTGETVPKGQGVVNTGDVLSQVTPEQITNFISTVGENIATVRHAASTHDGAGNYALAA